MFRRFFRGYKAQALILEREIESFKDTWQKVSGGECIAFVDTEPVTGLVEKLGAVAYVALHPITTYKHADLLLRINSSYPKD